MAARLMAVPLWGRILGTFSKTCARMPRSCIPRASASPAKPPPTMQTSISIAIFVLSIKFQNFETLLTAVRASELFLAKVGAKRAYLGNVFQKRTNESHFVHVDPPLAVNIQRWRSKGRQRWCSLFSIHAPLTLCQSPSGRLGGFRYQIASY